MKIEIRPLTLLAATYIAANFREADKAELKAATPTTSPEDFAFSIVAAPGWHYAAYLDGNPVFMFGLVQSPPSPHIAVAWGFGTNDTPRVMLAVSKFILNDLFKRAVEAGIHRVEVRVAASHVVSFNWLTKCLGAKLETLMRRMGASGEAFFLLSWTKEPKANVSINAHGESEITGSFGSTV